MISKFQTNEGDNIFGIYEISSKYNNVLKEEKKQVKKPQMEKTENLIEMIN